MSWTGSENERREQGTCRHAPGFVDKPAAPRGTDSYAGESGQRLRPNRPLFKKATKYVVKSGTPCLVKRTTEKGWRKHATSKTLEFKGHYHCEHGMLTFRQGEWLMQVFGRLVKRIK